MKMIMTKIIKKRKTMKLMKNKEQICQITKLKHVYKLEIIASPLVAWKNSDVILIQLYVTSGLGGMVLLEERHVI